MAFTVSSVRHDEAIGMALMTTTMEHGLYSALRAEGPVARNWAMAENREHSQEWDIGPSKNSRRTWW